MEELYADDGPLAALAPFNVQPAWREGSKPSEPVLTLGVMFHDLAAGFSAVEGIARRHGLEVTVQVSEEQHTKDPLAWLRPSHPPVRRELFDVWLLGAGYSAREVAHRLEKLRHGRHVEVPGLLKLIPDTVLKRLTRARAEEAVRLLREGGANAELRPTE